MPEIYPEELMCPYCDGTGEGEIPPGANVHLPCVTCGGCGLIPRGTKISGRRLTSPETPVARDWLPSGPAIRHTVPLTDLGGPHEAGRAAGIPRGSIGHHTQVNGFPRPVKRLKGTRLYDLKAVRAWAAERDTEDKSGH